MIEFNRLQAFDFLDTHLKADLNDSLFEYFQNEGAPYKEWQTFYEGKASAINLALSTLFIATDGSYGVEYKPIEEVISDYQRGNKEEAQ